MEHFGGNWLGNGVFHGEELEDALAGGAGLVELVVHAGERLHRRIDEDDAEDEGHEVGFAGLLGLGEADIVFENVDFNFGEKAILRNINLTVKAGEMVALVGASGSGKTTMANLLLRFYDPLRGAVKIGGVDLRDVKTADLRNQIAVVAQENILFNDTAILSWAASARRKRRSSPPPILPRRRNSSPRNREASTRSSVKKASCSPAAKNNASPSDGPCCAVLPS